MLVWPNHSAAPDEVQLQLVASSASPSGNVTDTLAILLATNDTLTLTNLQFSQSGAYQLVASNSYGVVASKIAKVSVTLPLGEALDATNWSWTSSGAALW